MVDSANDFESEIEGLLLKCKKDLRYKASQEAKEKILDYSKKIDIDVQNITDKKIKARYFNLKGRTLDLLEEYIREAEDALSKSLKLNPSEPTTWNTLGNILWKKGDYKEARKTFENCIENCGKNKESLRCLSMLMRSMDDKDKSNLVTESIKLAKEAISLDLKDGESWYVLGNAYLTNYFVNMKKLDELKNALKAYVKAESESQFEIPDLYYNRATIHNYLEEFSEAIDNFQKAERLDSSLLAKDQIMMIVERLKTIGHSIETKAKMKQKKLTNTIKSIPSVIRSAANMPSNTKLEVKGLDELVSGPNVGSLLSFKVTNTITKKGEVPAKFVYVDFKGNFGCLSIYHCNDDIYEKIHEHTEIYIKDPNVKQIKVKIDLDTEISYQTIQLFDPEKLYVDSNKVQTVFSPSQVINKAK